MRPAIRVRVRVRVRALRRPLSETSHPTTKPLPKFWISSAFKTAGGLLWTESLWWARFTSRSEPTTETLKEASNCAHWRLKFIGRRLLWERKQVK